MAEFGKTHKIFRGKLNARDHSRLFDVGERMILKWGFMWTVTQDRDQ